MKKAATCVLVVFILTSCGSTQQNLAASLSDAASSTTSVRLALTAEGKSQVTDAFANTMVDEALKETSTALTKATALKASTAKDSRHQTQTIKALHQAIAVLLEAQKSLANAPGSWTPHHVLTELRSISQELSSLERDLGGPR